MAENYDSTPDALGSSETFIAFQERLSHAAKVDRPVLIIGERGSGKELAAKRVHYLSSRWEGPLVALNCAALSESVLESELFGHEAGAFTGATKQRRGRFEAADGGTLFLDEIGLLSIPVQEKILRVVEYGSFERVGSSQAIRVDARIVGATNADLPKLAREGKFKEDLLDRLSFDALYLPPLRARREDIVHLAHHFAAHMAQELGWDNPPEFSEIALDLLIDYSWPGNIRELKNVVERSVYRSSGDVIRTIDFDPFRNPFAEVEMGTSSEEEAAKGFHSLKDELRALELKRLREALMACRGRQGEAAARLGLSYHQFRSLYRKHKDDL